MTLERLLKKDTQVVAVVDNQWGDTGKGKVVDVFAEWADVVARGTGGNNAGHTIVLPDREIILHLLNVGAVYDKITVLGNGMVIDIESLVKEMEELAIGGYSCEKIMVSRDAQVVMPYQAGLDQAKNKSQKDGGIGSTGRGIGPCYTDKIARRGIKIQDLYDRDALTSKIKKASAYYQGIKNNAGEIIEIKINVEDIIEQLTPYARKLQPFVRDTIAEMNKFWKEGKKIVLEGAQGLLLSVEYGTYPYVTSSDPSLNGTAAGVGLSARAIDLPLGVFKFPFMTRVGGGPFPTEIGSVLSELYCQGERNNKKKALLDYGIPFAEEGKSGGEKKIIYDCNHPKILEMLNSKDVLEQAIGLRLRANEFGATTGRPRRVGWTDAVAGRYAQMINGTKIILTKADCLAGMEEFKLCFGYQHPEKSDAEFKEFFEFGRDNDFLRAVQPSYQHYKGYGDISSVEKFGDFPPSLIQAITDFEDCTHGKVAAVSNGPRKENIVFK